MLQSGIYKIRINYSGTKLINNQGQITGEFDNIYNLISYLKGTHKYRFVNSQEIEVFESLIAI